MADKFINQLPAAGTVDGTEIVPLMQGGVTKQITLQGLLFFPTGLLVINTVSGSAIAASTSVTCRTFLVTSTDDGSTSGQLTATGFGGQAQGTVALGGALTVTKGFGANGNAPQTKATVNAAAVDPATTMALVNQLRAALIANGICV
jgi:hypothetical protein